MSIRQPNDVGAGGEAFAVREDPHEAGAGALGEIGEHLAGRPVAIGEEYQAGRQARRPNAVRLQVGLESVVEQHQAGEVKPLEQRERHDGIARIGDAGLGVHRAEQRTQACLLAGRDRRDHHEVVLRRHAQNCRQKSIRRSLAQYTLPR